LGNRGYILRKKFPLQAQTNRNVLTDFRSNLFSVKNLAQGYKEKEFTPQKHETWKTRKKKEHFSHGHTRTVDIIASYRLPVVNCQLPVVGCQLG
jgi:hypothetical protein